MSFKTLSEKVVRLVNSVIGEEYSYTPSGESPILIKGVFDNAWIDVEGVASLRPILRVDLADFETPPGKGDAVEIDEVNYRIVMSHPDGYGGSSLILQKV